VDYSGGSGRTLFEAGGGDDSLSGGGNADTLSGGAGNDTIANYTYFYDDDVQDQLSGGAGDDLIYAGTDDVVDGGSGNDRIYLSGTAQVRAGDGHDFIEASNGNDRIDGGTGSDTVSYADAFQDVTVNLNANGGQDTGGGGVDTLSGIENVIGGSRDDTITGTAGANVLEGGRGDDALYAGAGRDTASYSTSTQAVAVDLRVTTAQQTGGAGIDLLSGFENLTGGEGNDSLYGDARGNVLTGGEGNDLLNGRLGFDIVSYEGGSERVQVSLAIRSPQPAGGTNGTDTIVNVEGLRGTVFDDGLEGDNGANLLAGLDGADVLAGGVGNDTLVGGGGADRMRGGEGSDTFVYARTTDSGWDERDLILGFSRADGDRIDLTGIDARPLAGHQEFVFGSTQVGGLSLAEAGADTLVLANTDLDRDFELAIIIRDGAVRASAYTHDDFVWG
jgi:Ca2+-binding RTX toxin-like protein